MKRIKVNGVLVHAVSYYKKQIFITYEEATRLLITYPSLDFTIWHRIRKKELSLANLEDFKPWSTDKFVILNLNTAGIQDGTEIEFSLHEVGAECMCSIAAHIKRLGGLVDYDDEDICASVRNYRVGTIHRMSLDKDGDILVPHYFEINRTLLSMLINEQITVEELLSLLRGLENINPLHIEKA